ncbi:nuclear transport factor 2 family protein [Kineococcus sp. SYSU DK002]|uniref:nuclear transport factor 2 family protein n=1 Tax=Kineococcus sp. SYSU DK002 TaxID=3383123 RepID=UPI003D7DCD59
MKRSALITGLPLGLALSLACAPSASAVPALDSGTHFIHHQSHHNHQSHQAPRIVKTWLKAWNDADAQRLGSLFTGDGRYTDHAFGPTFTGPAGVQQWVANTHAGIADVRGDLRWAHKHGDEIVFSWYFSGHFRGAPEGFRVPAVTVITLRGNKIATNDDYYSHADVLAQSGLPADWQPDA